jgi:hypothetical protein
MLCNHVTRIAGLISATAFCNQFMTMKLILIWLSFSGETWFHLHGQVSSQNNRHCSSKECVCVCVCVCVQEELSAHLLHRWVNFIVFVEQYFNRIGKRLSRLEVSHAVHAGSREVTVAFNFVSGRIVLYQPAFALRDRGNPVRTPVSRRRSEPGSPEYKAGTLPQN